VRKIKLIFLGFVLLSEVSASEDVLEKLIDEVMIEVRTQCILNNSKIQMSNCLAQQAQDNFKKQDESLKRLYEAAQTPGSPLASLKRDTIIEKGDNVELTQPKFRDSVEKLIRERPDALTEFPMLKKYLQDQARFTTYRQAFRYANRDKNLCVFPEAAFQDIHDEALKNKKCAENCEYKKKAKPGNDDDHIYCQKYVTGAKGTVQKLVQKNKNAHIQSCMMEEPFLKEAPHCTPPHLESPQDCDINEGLKAIGLESGQDTIQALLQSAGACGYIQMLRMRAISQLIKSYKDLVLDKITIPDSCKKNFAELFEKTKRTNEKESANEPVKPHRIDNYVSLIRAAAINNKKNIHKIELLKEENERLKSRPDPKLLGDLKEDRFDMLDPGQKSALLLKEDLEFRRLGQEKIKTNDDMIEQLKKEILESNAKFPYLAVRGQDESPFKVTEDLTFIAETKSDEQIKNKIKTLSHNVGADLISSMEVYCMNEDQTNSAGVKGISGKDLVSNPTLTQSVLSGKDGLGQFQGFDYMQSCLYKAAGNETIKTAGVAGITGACLTASLLASPTVIGSFIIGAACGAVSVAMAFEDLKEVKAESENIAASSNAGQSIYNVDQQKSSLDKLSADEEALIESLANAVLDNASPIVSGFAGTIRKGLLAIKEASGDSRKFIESKNKLKQLLVSAEFKVAGQEQKVLIIEKTLKDETSQILNSVNEINRSKEIAEIVMDNELHTLAKSFGRNKEEQDFLIEVMAELKRRHGSDKKKITDEFYNLVGKCET